MSNEDKLYFFQEPVEDQISGYTKIIKTPMCFANVRERAKTNTYLIEPSALRRDINLIFDNAMRFNLPKHRVHKDAKKLGALCNAILDSTQIRLDLNSSRTLDENKHKEWLRLQRQVELYQDLKTKGFRMLRPSSELLAALEDDKKPQYLL
jgi:hypothetical protein